ncbi:hypothetical protein AGABI1DRAFT_111212 [Agaricus bisporus var. burnettii JB137-S8]|uniref:Dihydrodipicolinate synthase n=1 Tax=Agaricus bisporus var. burnettii (strain JB137-S8 / ATCC MYA-4627 / FGSC 10392) TaxID=597362 RepID=K5XH91_AGABU|nr:uncharacterized protein AGABI1DRAFT_111212 [Agaricus bisporus var. burnettii JB137-S8]EKM82617.1 hypothetical protein AGABI1DRAFT_111212 [Agaricus bisporus var. burnettii JB137-S8]
MASSDVGALNGHSPAVRALKPGVYAPIPTFFLPHTEDLDLPSFEGHVARIARAGVTPVIAGSMGEAIHLSHAERTTLIQAARKVLDGIGLVHMPIIAGSGGGSTRETLELTKEAAAAGADYVLVIASAYFAGALAGSREALKSYWTEVSQKSPVPVMIYNYPGASGGIDLDSDLITDLAKDCPNICGVKLTCGNVGKLTRIADDISHPSFVDAHPRQNPNAPFLVLGGYADFLTPSLFANAHGAITGLANITPHAVAKLFQLSEAARKDPSQLPEAQRIQGILARADFTIAKTSIAGTKYLIEQLYGYGGAPRKPLPPIPASAAKSLWEHPHTQEAVKLERELSNKIIN